MSYPFYCQSILKCNISFHGDEPFNSIICKDVPVAFITKQKNSYQIHKKFGRSSFAIISDTVLRIGYKGEAILDLFLVDYRYRFPEKIHLRKQH
jgi:hypothetical protein